MPTIGVKIRVFVPREVLDSARVVHNIEHTMVQKTQPDIRRELEKTVRTWDHKPSWSLDHFFGVRAMWVKVYTDNVQYRLVNSGARPHEIRPRRAKMLRFQTGFRPKTRPRLIGSFAGGKFGSYISTPVVHHPGHEAREFDAQIAEEYQDTFKKDVQDAIKDALA